MKNPSLTELKRWLPERRAAAHKGDFGHLLVVAGSRGMTGAAVLAARGALRAGAGLVTAALPESQQPIAAAALVEAMTLPLPESGGEIRADAVARVLASHERRAYTVLAIGPGLGAHSEPARLIVGLLGSLHIPAVADADALNVLAMSQQGEVRTLLQRRKAPCILTPHPGEAARLLRTTTASVMKDREGAARLLQSRFGGVCLLKGARSVLTDGERLWVNPTGNPGLAKGGSGDALTGIIAGIWCQRLAAAPCASDNSRVGAGPGRIRAAGPFDCGFEAAALGAWLHGAAADHAAREKGSRSLLASDVIEALPAAFRKLGG